MFSIFSPRRAGPAMCAGDGSAGSTCRRGAIRARAPTSTSCGATLGTSSMPRRLSLKAQSFTESVIREMTRLNLALNRTERAINFAQAFPDFATDPRILEAAALALRDGFNQYATTWGAPQLRQAVARKQGVVWGREVDPDAEITVSCGATEALITAILPPFDPPH